MLGFGGAKLKEKSLKNGKYLLDYNISDIYGNRINANAVILNKQGLKKSLQQ
jgi:hypothetical protein